MYICKWGCNLRSQNEYRYGHVPALNICECGCEQKCKTRFVQGHNTSWNKGKTKETDKRLAFYAEKIKGKVKTEEHRRNLGLSQLGKKHSPERNARKSARQMGHEVTQETRRKIGLKNKGNHYRPRTEEEKHQMSLSHLEKNKYVRTEEMKRNMSIAHLGIIPSKESNLKRSASLKKTWTVRGDEILNSMMRHKKWSRFSYSQKSGQVIKMRSSWEIKYADYLDSLNIVWQYEPKGFLLSNGHQYFPDFYLPEINEWREIKGWMSLRSQEKLDLFAKDYPNEKLVVLKDILKYIENKGSP